MHVIRENPFFKDINFRPIRIRENMKVHLPTIFSLESRQESILMLRKFDWLLLYIPKAWQIDFFLEKFFHQSEFEKIWKSFWRQSAHWNRERTRYWCWENSIDFCSIFQTRGKSIFSYKNFSTNQNSTKIWKSISGAFAHWNRERSRYWCWENSIDFCSIFQTRGKSIFSYKNFTTNQNSRKYESPFRELLLIGIERRVVTDAEKIRFTFVWCTWSVKIHFLKT